MMCNYGVLIEIAILVIVVYVPFIHLGFQTQPVHGLFLVPGICGGALIWIYAETRKYFSRNYPGSLSFLTW